MKEETTKVETYRVRALCENCGGEMKATNVVKTCNPPLYPHRCVTCGRSVDSLKSYPRIEYSNEE